MYLLERIWNAGFSSLTKEEASAASNALVLSTLELAVISGFPDESSLQPKNETVQKADLAR